MSNSPFIFFEDNNIIVVKKPAKMPSQADKTQDIDLLSLLQMHCDTKEIYLLHRLDRPVSGIMVYAKTKEAAANISTQISEHKLHKTYMALLCGHAPSEGNLCDYIIKNQRLNISKIVHKNEKNAKEALLSYQCLDVFEHFNQTFSLVKIKLITGRHHQIRVQFANASLPLWGDTKYNPYFARTHGYIQLALWAYELSFFHPVTGKQLSFHMNVL